MHSAIHFDTRWFGPHGIGRFASELFSGLPGCVPLDIAVAKLSPFDPLASSWVASKLHAGCYFSPGFNPPLRCPVPLFFTIHDLIHLRIPEESSAVRRLYYRTVVLPAARRATRVLTVSEHSKRDILEWSGLPAERVSVVGNGVSSAFAPEGEAYASAQPYFLHVGRRANHKNVPALIQAFALSGLPGQARLVFTGAPDTATVNAAARAGISGAIDFREQLDDESLASLYRGALALVFPSLYEGFGLPIVEAMACGTPVITSRGSSMAEVAGEGNALFVDPHEPAELAHAMECVAADASLRTRLRDKGMKRAGTYRWDRVIDRVRDALTSPEA